MERNLFSIKQVLFSSHECTIVCARTMWCNNCVKGLKIHTFQIKAPTTANKKLNNLVEAGLPSAPTPSDFIDTLQAIYMRTQEPTPPDPMFGKLYIGAGLKRTVGTLKVELTSMTSALKFDAIWCAKNLNIQAWMTGSLVGHVLWSTLNTNLAIWPSRKSQKPKNRDMHINKKYTGIEGWRHLPAWCWKNAREGTTQKFLWEGALTKPYYQVIEEFGEKYEEYLTQLSNEVFAKSKGGIP